jgi:hypothetical protein
MQSSLIGKIQKAHMYAQEPDRVTFSGFSAAFRGEHDSYTVRFLGEGWDCTCGFFGAHGICSHIMATQKILGSMLPSDARYWTGAEREAAVTG